MINWMDVLWVVLTLAIGLAARYLVPWLKERLGEAKLQNLVNWVDVLVRAAEQLMPNPPGSERLKWVKAQLADMGFASDDASTRALIESAVYDLKPDDPPSVPGNPAN